MQWESRLRDATEITVSRPKRAILCIYLITEFPFFSNFLQVLFISICAYICMQNKIQNIELKCTSLQYNAIWYEEMPNYHITTDCSTIQHSIVKKSSLLSFSSILSNLQYLILQICIYRYRPCTHRIKTVRLKTKQMMFSMSKCILGVESNS